MDKEFLFDLFLFCFPFCVLISFFSTFHRYNENVLRKLKEIKEKDIEENE